MSSKRGNQKKRRRFKEKGRGEKIVHRVCGEDKMKEITRVLKGKRGTNEVKHRKFANQVLRTRPQVLGRVRVSGLSKEGKLNRG